MKKELFRCGKNELSRLQKWVLCTSILRKTLYSSSSNKLGLRIGNLEYSSSQRRKLNSVFVDGGKLDTDQFNGEHRLF